ncbi:MAG: phosphatidate cytidylyltransferase [Elusimicrobia bacterium]|nr:phosphatidate cytidylyltransferase [Elusimicrobiota bacterium]
MLLPRVLTAVVGIPLLLLVIHWGGLAFAVFTAGISALALYEYGVILEMGRRPVQSVLAIVLGTALALCQALGGPVAPAAALMVVVVMLREMASRPSSLDRAALTVFGAVLLGWMPAHLALIRDIRPYGERMTFMFFVSVWVMDTTAYFVGKTLGRRKLAPELSPKKTVEGFLAGFIAAVLTVLAFRASEPGMLSVRRALALGVLIGTGGQVSDIAESMIKRAVGVKDSGSLLPGHGGVMDRFDSFLLSAPAVYYCLVF